MQKLLLIISICCSTLMVKAQSSEPEHTTAAISAGLELNLPQRSRYNIGYGASAKFELPLTQSVSLAVTSGIYQFHTKTFFCKQIRW